MTDHHNHNPPRPAYVDLSSLRCYECGAPATHTAEGYECPGDAVEERFLCTHHANQYLGWMPWCVGWPIH